MREIPFIPEQKSHLSEKAAARYLRKRLTEMTAVLEKLLEAGWPVRLTTTGLAFDPPLSEDESGDPEVVQNQLMALGIDEECVTASRTVQDIQDAVDEYEDRVRYDDLDRHFRDPTHQFDRERDADTLREMRTLEGQYGRRTLMIGSEFERGVLYGKLEALLWVRGGQWWSPFYRHVLHKGIELGTAADFAERMRGRKDHKDDADEDAR